jgi:hypothetical protein
MFRHDLKETVWPRVRQARDDDDRGEAALSAPVKGAVRRNRKCMCANQGKSKYGEI